VESMVSRPLAISNAHIFAISGAGDVAIGLAPKMAVPPQGLNATLARVPLAGGAPRPLLQDVYAADYQPSSDQLAIVRMVDNAIRVEFPPGKVLYQTSGWVSAIRFSRDGKRLAIADHPLRWDDRGDIAVLDLEGHKTVVSPGWEAIEGLAWSATGDEIWFAAAKSGFPHSLWAATEKGRLRQLLASPSPLFLSDVGGDGRVLIASDDGIRKEVTAVVAGDPREQSLAFLDQSDAIDLSDDGKTLLFTEESAGRNYSVCLRKTDGSPVVVLGEGAAASLSADGKWALAILLNRPYELLAIPTGAGETVHVPKIGLDYGAARWLPDSKRILFRADAPGKSSRLYVQSIFPLGEPRAITGDGMSVPNKGISPDGKLIAAWHSGDPLAIYPIDGGEPLKIAGLSPGDDFLRWKDGDNLYFAAAAGCHLRIYQLNWRTGASHNVRELMPGDQAGVFAMQSMLLTPDASTMVYGFARLLVNLQIVDGVR
jgi:eukaryotic-like serine/threonine-protein kinase